jgi:TolB-like protein/DNA-binding winged helix-turn-helix (wHTH) protein/Flp pilus assembly protein TadD
VLNEDFLIDGWTVRPRRDCIERGSEVVHLAPKAMAVLCRLAEARGAVVSRQELFDAVWPDAQVTDDALTQRVAELRKGFGDRARSPSIIETIPKVGFRLMPAVTRIPGTLPARSVQAESGERRRKRASVSLGIAATLMLAAVAAWLVQDKPEKINDEFTDQLPLADIESSLAVLPFVDLSSTMDELHFADAVHEEIITRLGRIAALKVISKNSSEKYKGSEQALPDIASELSVDAILTGSIQRSEDKVRVRTQLVDVANDRYLWAASFDRDLTATNIFAIQTEIAENVARSLLASLSPAESTRIAEVPTDNFEVYQALLRGHIALRRGTLASFHEAIACYQRALSINPEFPQAYLAMARAYIAAVEELSFPEPDVREKIEEFARAAIELDPGLGLAYNYLAVVRRENGQLYEAEKLFQRALQLEPNDPRILHGMGLNLRLQGRAREAIPYYDRAIQVDPLSPAWQESRGSLLRDLGRFRQAEQQYRDTLDLDPAYVNAHWGLGTLYWSMGQPGKARVWFENAVRRAPQSDVFMGWLALMYLELEDYANARDTIDAALRLADVASHNDAVLAEELYRLYVGLEVSDLPDGRQFTSRYWYGGVVDLPPRTLMDGRYDAAINELEALYPGLAKGSITIDGSNFRNAIYLALALRETGEIRRAHALLDAVENFLPRVPRLGLHGYWVADAQILAIRGDLSGSLKHLELAIDEGWRNLWQFYLLHDPTLRPLSTRDELDALVRRLRDGRGSSRAEPVTASRTVVLPY